MKLACPTCGYAEEIAPSTIPPGTRVTCPTCGEVFTPATAPAAAFQDDGPTIEKRTAPREQCRTELPTSPVPVENSVLLPPSGPLPCFPSGRSEIISWVKNGHLAPEVLPRATRIAGMLPGPAQWRIFLDGLALWLGAVFLATAVIFFFAYNWQALGHYARFGCAELLLVAAVAAAWRLGLERTSGKAALLTATLLVGALLALVGQTYQTGADTWELFGSWALLVFPWVLLSRFAPLWLFWLTLLNLAAALYFATFGGLLGLVFGTEGLVWTLSILNSAALALWELAAGAGIPWLEQRWAPRVVATAATANVGLLACWGIVDDSRSGLGELAAYALLLTAGYVAYRRRYPDLYMLSLGVVSLVIVASVFLAHALGLGGDGGEFLLIGMTVLGMSALGGMWLRGIGQEVAR